MYNNLARGGALPGGLGFRWAAFGLRLHPGLFVSGPGPGEAGGVAVHLQLVHLHVDLLGE